MKIFLNNFLNLNNSIQKPKNASNPFFNEKISFKSQPTQDIFAHSADKEEEYLDTQAFKKMYSNESDMEEDVTRILTENYAAYFYFRTLREKLNFMKLPFFSSEKLHDGILQSISPINREKIINSLEQGEIDNLKKLENLINTYFQIPNADQVNLEFDFLDVYTKTKATKEILNFPTVLLTANTLKRFGYDEFDPEQMISFIRLLNIKNEAEFFKKYQHLAQHFDNFDSEPDKVIAFAHATHSSKDQIEAIEFALLGTPYIKNLNVRKFYQEYADVIDYLYNRQDINFIVELTKLLIYIGTQQEKIQPNALKIMSQFGDINSAQGKFEMYDFLFEENITIKELNKLTKTQHIEGINLIDPLVNRSENMYSIMGFLDLNYHAAEEIYADFAQTIDTINQHKTGEELENPAATLFKIINLFGFKDEKELIKLYNDLSSTKADKKAKKKNHTQNKKITPSKLMEFLELLSFLDPNMVQKHKTEKSYQLLKELKNKKADFEKISSNLEKLIDEKHSRYLCKNAFTVFNNHYDSYKKSYSLNLFLDKAIEEEEKKLQEEQSSSFNFEKFAEYFRDKELFINFLIKNEIWLNDGTDNHSNICAKILDILFKNKTEEELQELCKKLSESDFIKNSKNSLAGYITSKSPEEINIIFDIVLNENIQSLNEFNSLVAPYQSKNKKIDKLLEHYNNQNLDFITYLQKISQIQKEINTLGFDIQIKNDNINAITKEDMTARKIDSTRIKILAKELLNIKGEGNFLCHLKNSLSPICKTHSQAKIAKEIVNGQVGKYKENYSGFLKNFDLSNSRHSFESPYPSEYATELENKFRGKLKAVYNFINSDSWLPKFENNKVPNLCLHAKMRLIDRFILQENKDLFSKETEKELKEILNTVYTTLPYKIEKSETANALYFKHQNYEIKAVFEPDGEMITIAKNKL